MLRYFLSVFLLLATAASGGGQEPAKVVVVKIDPIFNLYAGGKDLVDDLGCVAYDPNDLSTISKATGLGNSQKINDAIASGETLLGDRHGRMFAVATDDPTKPFCIHIPPSGGGTLFGAGWHQNRALNATAPPSTGTTFFNVSDGADVPFSEQEVIRYEGIGWTFGPFTINGTGKTGNAAADAAFSANEIAGYGFRTVTAPGSMFNAGLSVGAISLVNCDKGVYYSDDASAVWALLAFGKVRYGYVVDGGQALNHEVYRARMGGAGLEAMFDFRDGGALNVHMVDLNGPTTLLRIGENGSNNRRYEIHGIHGDTGFFADSSAKLLDMQSPKLNPHASVRMSGRLPALSAPGRLIHPQGLTYDIELDLLNMPTDEATAYARKPYPIVAPTVFHAPDVGLDEDFTPPGSDWQIWLDTTHAPSITFDANGRVETIAGRFGAPNTVTQAAAANRPTLVADGLHHRPALAATGGNHHLVDETKEGVTGLNDFEVWAVASQANTTVSRTIAGVWDTANQRSWRLGVTGTKHIQFQISTAGTALTTSTITSDDPIPNNTPVLIYVKRVSGTLTMTVNAISKTQTAESGATLDSAAPLSVLTHFASGTLSGRYSGRVQFLALRGTVSNQTDFEAVRDHWRRKAGVW